MQTCLCSAVGSTKYENGPVSLPGSHPPVGLQFLEMHSDTNPQHFVPVSRPDKYQIGGYLTSLHSAGALDTQDPSSNKAAALGKRLSAGPQGIPSCLKFIHLLYEKQPSLRRKHQSLFELPFSTRPGKTQTYKSFTAPSLLDITDNKQYNTYHFNVFQITYLAPLLTISHNYSSSQRHHKC